MNRSLFFFRVNLFVMARTSRMLHTNNITSSWCKAMLRFVAEVFPIRSSMIPDRRKTTLPLCREESNLLTIHERRKTRKNINRHCDLLLFIYLFIYLYELISHTETEALLFTTNYISLSWRATRYLMLTSVSHNQITNKLFFFSFLLTPVARGL